MACLLIVRDDFWMSVHRLFQEIDIGLSERENCAAVDLFDMRHARHILCEFGRAYGTLPGSTEDLTAEQVAFLDRAIAELAEDDRVICVRLALFAYMIRDRPWSIATLESIGGARGVGIRFLEDVFGPHSSPLSYRAYRDAPRDVLRSLMPPPGTEIRACTRTAEELAKVANLDRDGGDFHRLIRILEEETRLLMPVDVVEAGAAPAGPAPVEGPMPAYQLTHDYLVPSIREWLAR